MTGRGSRKRGGAARLFLRLLVCAAAVLCLALPARGEDVRFTRKDTGIGEAEEAWERFREAVPDKEALEGVDPSDPAGSLKALRERTGPAWLFGKLKDALSASARKTAEAALPLFALILLGAAVRAVRLTESMADGWGRVLRLAAAVSVYGMVFESVKLASGATELLCRLMELLVPVMEGLCIAGGNLTEARTLAVGVSIGVTAAGEVCGRLLVPLTGALAGLSAVSSGGGPASVFAEGLRKTVEKAWKLLVIAVSFLLGAQTVLARGTDSLGARGVKFALSSFVPVAGTALAEAWGTLSAGVRILRGAGGIGGILVLTTAALPVLVPLFLRQGMAALAEKGAELLGAEDLKGLFGGARGILGLLSAFVLYAMMLFVVFLAVFAGFGR